jgi:hypothetical protein
MIAIDAMPFGRQKLRQYERAMIDRELHKAHVGFADGDWTRVATGHWGCGAFGGDKYLKGDN